MKKNVIIKIPTDVSVKVLSNSLIIIGKLGELTLSKQEQFNCTVILETNTLKCALKGSGLIKKQLAYLNRQYLKFLTNLRTNLKGVSTGFFTELKLTGIGYRFLSYKNNTLLMKIGFCNHMSFSIPEGVTVFLESPTQVTLFSIDYLLVKQTAASLRAFRPPDAYKGKGFRYMSEILVLKEVKKNG